MPSWQINDFFTKSKQSEIELEGIPVDHVADLSLNLLPGGVVLENGLITDHGGVVPDHPGRHLELGALDVDQAEE